MPKILDDPIEIEDDPEIPDTTIIYRRLTDQHIVQDENRPGRRMTSNAFLDRDTDGISVYLEPVMKSCGLAVKDVVYGFPPGWGVAEITAAQARQAGLGVIHRVDPTAPYHPCNPAHGLLTGLLPGNAGSKQARRLTRPPARLHEF